jgi:hypothetical protein
VTQPKVSNRCSLGVVALDVSGVSNLGTELVVWVCDAQLAACGRGVWLGLCGI